MTRTILVVDDNEQVALSIMSALEGVPELRVIVVGNGHDALGVARDKAFLINAVITDFDLPVLDGFSLIREIRGLPLYRTVPVLMITGDISAVAGETSVSNGPNQILRKPFSCREVRRVVEQILLESSGATFAPGDTVPRTDIA